MGIHDRHYVRDEPARFSARGGGMGGGRPPAGLAAMRAWSVNTWIIIFCVAIFVVDGLLPKSWVVLDTGFHPDVSGPIDADSLTPGDVVTLVINPRTREPEIGTRPLFTSQGVQIAAQHLQTMHPIEEWLYFSTTKGFLNVQFWRFIGFQFLHGNFTHLIFNMIGLFFFGPMVERYLGSKRYLAFYLLCGICGALMYLALNLSGFIVSLLASQDVTIPGLLFNDPGTPLVGASAGIFGVLMAGAFLAPNATVLLFFILPMRLVTLAYALVAIALITLLFQGANAGGEAGHLGGAIAGFYFIRHPHHLHGFFDILGRVDPTSHHYRGKGAGAKARATARLTQRRGPNHAEIDRILDKVNAEGLQSLSAREKRILRDASERDPAS